MRVLLDTHAFLWFIMDDKHLSTKPLDVIRNSENEVLLSIASLWEIAIKSSIDKLKLLRPFDELFPEQLNLNRIVPLSISMSHLSRVAQLPFPVGHADPFDRLLISQAIIERLPIVSRVLE